jgi:hypothetical protein
LIVGGPCIYPEWRKNPESQIEVLPMAHEWRIGNCIDISRSHQIYRGIFFRIDGIGSVVSIQFAGGL